MSREEIYEFFVNNGGKEVCGRVLPSQLDYTYEERIVIINALLEKHRHTNLAFFLLALGSLTMLACNNENTINKNTEKIIQTESLKDRGKNLSYKKKRIPIVNQVDRPMVGGFGWGFSCKAVKDSMRFVEVMPQFEGGYDKLMDYLQANVKYPERERRNKVEGTVYVSFIVETDGSITHPEIVDSLPIATNFNKEVLRVINTMPNWVPGKQQGKNVAVEITIPVAFNLWRSHY